MSCSSCGHDNCGCCGTPAGCSCSANPSRTDCCNGNPCSPAECNTPECESLNSQINNFTKQFFGEVVKSEVNGEVVWTLPCDLEEGLPNNPRAADEGLACYFIRLFSEGIIGLTGPAGETGPAGTNGFNAYTVTLASFTQPSTGSPNVNVTVLPNPAILEGLYVFIGTSGWYVVNFVDPSGVLHLSLSQAVSGAVAGSTVTAGKLVVPAGHPGIGTTGPTGPQGPQGNQGVAGDTFTTINGGYFDNTGSNYTITTSAAAVDFSTSMAQVLLPDAGKYIVMASADILGLAGAVTSDFVEIKLRNITDSADLDGSLKQITNINSGRKSSMAIIPVPYTTSGANRTIRLYARASSAQYQVVALRTSITFFRLA
jgi:hypothetical protein